MAALKDRLKTDLTAAIRDRDELRKGTIRMVLAAITTAETSGHKVHELEAAELIAVLTREAKRRREAAEAFRSGGREDSALREEAEASVIAEYLPEPLTDAELRSIIDAAITEVSAESPRDMGKVMKAVQPRVAGRVEGGRVAGAVRERLS